MKQRKTSKMKTKTLRIFIAIYLIALTVMSAKAHIEKENTTEPINIKYYE